MYRRRPDINRPAKGRKLLLFTLVFWGLSCIMTLVFLRGEPNLTDSVFKEQIGKKYLSAAYPIISRGGGADAREVTANLEEADDDADCYSEDETMVVEKVIIDTAVSNSPLVLIYHTHATESYLPISSGNFHSSEEPGTVREVGSILAKSLKAKGISVIHDKTVHDLPSYSKSYSRSMETVRAILKKNPSIVYIIDLHRDAAAYTGNKGCVFTADGKKAAQFSLVVGLGNENKEKLLTFANTVLKKANGIYPGFGKGIIKKDYKYNQYIADCCLLLEMGNNQNDIEEAKQSAIYFADVLAEIIKGSSD